MDMFRVALTRDFLKPDGRPNFPELDLSPLDKEPRLQWDYIPAAGEIRAADIAGYDALILLSPRFTRASLPDDGQLAVIARFGVGFDTVEVGPLAEAGVATVITPDGVRRPVAVAILTLLLALSGRLMVKDEITRNGPKRWHERTDHNGIGLIGRTLGSVGMGSIGAEMFRVCKPLDMRFIAHDPYADPAVAATLGVELVDLDEVFRRADFVTVNCPLTSQTRHLVNAARLALMQPTAFLINTARGPIVDQRALTTALLERRIAGAGLDVLEQEPPAADDPILALDNVILTPHALCWTDQMFARLGQIDVQAVIDVMHGRVPGPVAERSVLANPRFLAKLERNRQRFGD